MHACRIFAVFHMIEIANHLFGLYLVEWETTSGNNQVASKFEQIQKPFNP